MVVEGPADRQLDQRGFGAVADGIAELDRVAAARLRRDVVAGHQAAVVFEAVLFQQVEGVTAEVTGGRALAAGFPARPYRKRSGQGKRAYVRVNPVGRRSIK